ncbi:MAG: hypothetical protein L6416_01605 [Candidatus Omnitrophica bacterium]|nr:hypothetical protein [Candidatus Omnitrophota bacterium]
MRKTYMYFCIFAQIILGASAGLCQEQAHSPYSNSNLSPQITLQNNLLHDIFITYKIAPLSSAHTIQRIETLKPEQDTSWIDIEEITFPLKVIISSTRESLITFEMIEEKRFLGEKAEKKISTINHLDQNHRSRISGTGILGIGHRFIKDSIEDDEFATIEIQKASNYLKIKNSGTMDLNIIFESNRDNTGKLTTFSSSQIKFIIHQLNTNYSCNSIQCNIIKLYLLGNISREKAINFLSSFQSKNEKEHINWAKVICALPLTTKHQINITLAEKMIEKIWDYYKHFGTYNKNEYIDEILELLLITEMPADRFLLVKKAYEPTLSNLIEILKVTNDYCSGKEIADVDINSWTASDFLEGISVMGYKLDWMKVRILSKFLLRKTTFKELTADPLNAGILGLLEKTVYPDTDINPWKKSVMKISEDNIQDIDLLAKICFIMFEADRKNIHLQQYAVIQIAMHLSSIIEIPQALYPLAMAAIEKDRADSYPSITKEQVEVYRKNIKSIIEDAKVLAGYKAPKLKIQKSAIDSQKQSTFNHNIKNIEQSI